MSQMPSFLSGSARAARIRRIPITGYTDMGGGEGTGVDQNAPQTVSITCGTTHVILWTNPIAYTSINIERMIAFVGIWESIATLPLGTETTWTDPGSFISGETYIYRLRGNTAKGPTGWSRKIQCVVPITAAYYWLGTTDSDSHIALNWSATDGGAPANTIPGRNTDVYFTGLGNNACTLTEAASWGSINFTSGYTAQFNPAGYSVTLPSNATPAFLQFTTTSEDATEWVVQVTIGVKWSIGFGDGSATEHYTGTGADQTVNHYYAAAGAGDKSVWIWVEDKTDVLKINVNGNSLSGSIPSLTGLTSLEFFYCYSNSLTGSIPSLTGLTSLSYFYCYSNSLTGTIPSLTGLTSLVHFYCYGNSLSGLIPSLTGLTSLVTFYCHNNSLTGSIPSLTGLTSLEFFYCYGNSLTGSIPSLTGLTSLVTFHCYGNSLTGSIPSLTGLTSLVTFHCYNNSLSGFDGGSVSATLLDFRADTNNLITQASDDILSALDTAGGINGTCNLGGASNAEPSTAGYVDKTDLEGKGWTVTVGSLGYHWVGTTTDTAVGSNWSSGAVPTTDAYVLFQSANNNNCTPTTNLDWDSIEWESGYTATFDASAGNHDLDISGDIITIGAMTYTKGNGTLTFTLAADQDVDFSGSAIEDVVVDKSAGALTFSESCDPDSITQIAGEIRIADTKTLTVSGNCVFNDHLTGVTNPVILNVVGSNVAHNATITNINCTGTPLDATDNCIDGGGNTNVNFT